MPQSAELSEPAQSTHRLEVGRQENVHEVCRREAGGGAEQPTLLDQPAPMTPALAQAGPGSTVSVGAHHMAHFALAQARRRDEGGQSKANTLLEDIAECDAVSLFLPRLAGVGQDVFAFLGACLADLSAHATSSVAEGPHRPPKTDPTGNSSGVPQG